MTHTSTLPLTDRFNSLIEGLFKDVATEIPEGGIVLPLIVVFWRRLHRLRARFASIMARFRAGTLPAPGSARRDPAPGRPSEGPRPVELPRRFGWVLQLYSWFLMTRCHELEELIEDPETAANVADAPQLGSVLRPMCQMMGVKPPAWLRLPRRARRRVVNRPPPAPDWLVNEPGAELRADGSVWMRLGASTKWRRPGLWDTLEQAQKFDRPVRIWPRD